MTTPPRGWVADGVWPHGRLAADAPAAAVRLAATARRISEVVEQLGAAALATAARVDRGELDDLLAGTAWPTVHLIVGLETYLAETLW